jgi:hypothetical protein
LHIAILRSRVAAVRKPRKEVVKVKRTTVLLPEELWKAVSKRAIDENRNFTALVKDALQRYMRGIKKGGGRHAR